MAWVARNPDAPRRTIPHLRACLALACLSACTSAAGEGVVVEYFGASAYTFSRAERRVIETIANAAAAEVRRALPALPRTLTLQVRPGGEVIAETGETATAILPGTVHWTVDPTRHGGVRAIAGKQLRATLFHELHHLVRDASVRSITLIDRAVTEGLATAFERDAAGGATPWGQYSDEVSAWTTELMALPDDTRRDHWMGRHPDGRRWIAFKVGTYLVDRAVRASGRSPADLVSEPTAQILLLAGK
jgi:hypothetical protein